ncbi:MAG: hypothetical protein Q7T45_28175 [Bradyrhizobium sp.]|uniref:hypothetical protein n=1 Tax=Bradyrhizobium sp. TaxID=376 RepID=UPI00271CFB99|nr:hypothetical protein [Bradyrhizobium sp.]MDO8401692.1 hypothetical protein [Bradyrhizobium sp.]
MLGYLFVADRTWVPFPSELRGALFRFGEHITKEKKKRERRNTISETVGKIAGGAAGYFVEAAAGKVAGKVSEMTVEAACKALAHRIMQ